MHIQGVGRGNIQQALVELVTGKLFEAQLVLCLGRRQRSCFRLIERDAARVLSVRRKPLPAKVRHGATLLALATLIISYGNLSGRRAAVSLLTVMLDLHQNGIGAVLISRHVQREHGNNPRTGRPWTPSTVDAIIKTARKRARLLDAS